MFRYIFVLALVPALAFATEGTKTCEDKNLPQPTYINVQGCEKAPCLIGLGTTAKMTLGFQAPRDIESFSPSVRAGVLGFFIDYVLPENLNEGCDFLTGTRCPLTATQDVVYNFEFPVDNSYPKIDVDVDLAISDKEGKFLCVRIPIKVVA